MGRRRSRVPGGAEPLCLFPGDVALRPRHVPGSSSRPSCIEAGHTWQRGQQIRLFGLPPDEVTYCAVCGKLYR